MPMWTQSNGGDWSEWRWKFAVLPSIAGQDGHGNKVWIWWDWYQRRSLFGGAYVEFRKPGVTKSAVMDLSY